MHLVFNCVMENCLCKSPWERANKAGMYVCMMGYETTQLTIKLYYIHREIYSLIRREINSHYIKTIEIPGAFAHKHLFMIAHT